MNRLTRWESNHTLLHRGMQLDVAAFVAFLTDQITKTQEAHGVLLNKHYEIPFVKEYAMGFPFLYSVKNATDYIALQETSYSG